MHIGSIQRRWEDLPLSHWDQPGNVFARTRAGWTPQDFATRKEGIFFDLAINPVGKDVLDLGCGLGYLCQHIAPTAASYTGIDWSIRQLRWAQDINRNQPNTTFLMCDGQSIPTIDNSFDIVICELLFQHIPKSTTDSYVREIQRVLRPAGTAYLQFPKSAEYPLSGRTEQDIRMLLPNCQFATGLAQDFYHYVIHVQD